MTLLLVSGLRACFLLHFARMIRAFARHKSGGKCLLQQIGARTVSDLIFNPVEQHRDGFELFNTLLNIYREFPTCGFASKISLTSPSSYHITVFGGLNDEDAHSSR